MSIMQERYRQNQAEYFEGMQSLDEVVGEYSRLMETVTQDHELRAGAIPTKHELSFLGEQQTPGSQDIDMTLNNTRVDLYNSLDETADKVHDITKAAAEIIPSMLSAHDQKVLQQVQAEMSTYGAGSRYVQQAMERASSPKAKMAIRASLDARLMGHIHSEIRTYGIQSRYVQEALKLASSPITQAAIRSSLDPAVLTQLRSNVRTYGIGSRYVQETVSLASSANIQKGMRAFLDKDVLSSLQEQIRTYGAGSRYVSTTLEYTSSSTVREIFARNITEAKAKEEQRHARYGYNSSNAGSYGSSEHSSSNGRFNYEDFVYGAFRNNNFSETNNREREYARQERPQQPQQDNEVEQVVGQVIARDRQYGWLRSEDPAAVRRVVNTVRAARAKAAESGEELTDRDIYLRYRRSIDKGEQNGKSTASPAMVKSYQIIDAMMGGNIRGKLPF